MNKHLQVASLTLFYKVASLTLLSLSRHVPPAVPGVFFLSGGQVLISPGQHDLDDHNYHDGHHGMILIITILSPSLLSLTLKQNHQQKKNLFSERGDGYRQPDGH